MRWVHFWLGPSGRGWSDICVITHQTHTLVQPADPNGDLHQPAVGRSVTSIDSWHQWTQSCCTGAHLQEADLMWWRHPPWETWWRSCSVGPLLWRSHVLLVWSSSFCIWVFTLILFKIFFMSEFCQIKSLFYSNDCVSLNHWSFSCPLSVRHFQ